MEFQESEQSGGALEVTLEGKRLTCPICGHDTFDKRGTLLNSRAGEFFGLAWADDKATNYICSKCGHILWFRV